MSEEIKNLATKSLEEKWNAIDSKSELSEWIKDCAYCIDAKNKMTSEPEETVCDFCLISNNEICKTIKKSYWVKEGNIIPIIKALEELRDDGVLSQETNNELIG